MKSKNWLTFIFGILLTCLALVLAYGYHYKHFYELLVVGLFLILVWLVGEHIAITEYKDMYKKFFKAGLVGDLLLGVTLTGLWHYNFQHPWDYIPIYLVVYPFGGFVMVQCYVLTKRWLSVGSKVQNRSRQFYARLTTALATISLVLLPMAIIVGDRTRLLWSAVFLSVALYVLAAWSAQIRANGGSGLFDVIFSYPLRMLVVIVLVSYFNAFLHEVPNTVAHEWTYANMPLMSTQIFGIPILALIGWPILTLYPATVYYYVHSKIGGESAEHESWLVKFFPLMPPPKSK